MASLIAQYLTDVNELDEYLAGKPVTLTGSSLSLPQLAAIALYPPSPSVSGPASATTAGPTLHLTTSSTVRAKVDASRAVIDTKMAAGLSIYGVSTGFGGSADTRTDDPVALGAALLQHQHAGVILPSSAQRSSWSGPASYTGPLPMPLTDPANGTTMPPPWTRAAMLIRANSLIRGHSGVRWTLVEKMTECIRKGLVPLVPLRGSISASGDLSPLSYVAGMLIGNPAIRVWVLSPPAPVPMSGPCTARAAPRARLTLDPISRTPSSSTDTSETTSPTSFACFSPTSPLSCPSTPASSVHSDDEDCVKPFLLDGHQPASAHPSHTLTATIKAVSASHALRVTGTVPLPLASKEHLGIVNGTAFSAGLAALVVRGAESVGVLSAVLTALAVEAMVGARGSFNPFVGEARPHVGQIEAAHLVHTLLAGSRFATDHEEEVRIEDDDGVLRQDRYSLRTAPQWLGPQFEELKRAKETVRIEMNSTTDNPLVEPHADGKGAGTVHHAGNFQALAMTVAMDHVRLAIAQLGRLMFVQLTELVNPAMNRGLPGNLAGGEAAHDFGCKGLDIAAASYAGELNALGGMNVGVGVVSAEMHNQSINSLALVSARYTLAALEVCELMAASHLFVLCQALDVRALHTEMGSRTRDVVRMVLVDSFPCLLAAYDSVEKDVVRKVIPAVLDELDRTTGVAIHVRMGRVAGAAVAPLLEMLSGVPGGAASFDLGAVSRFREELAGRLEALLGELRCAFMGAGVRRAGDSAPAWQFGIAGKGRAPAAEYLAPRTRRLYELVRLELGIGMCGGDNLAGRVYGMRAQDRAGGAEGWSGLEEAGLGKEVDTTYGDKVAMIVEAIRDGRVGRVVVEMCEGIDE